MRRIAPVMLFVFLGTLLLHGLLVLTESSIGSIGYWYTALMLLYAAVVGYVTREQAFWAGLIMTVAIGGIFLLSSATADDAWQTAFLTSIGTIAIGCIFCAIVGSKVREMFARA
jgi:hypothetical protein